MALIKYLMLVQTGRVTLSTSSSAVYMGDPRVDNDLSN